MFGRCVFYCNSGSTERQYSSIAVCLFAVVGLFFCEVYLVVRRDAEESKSRGLEKTFILDHCCEIVGQ